MNSKSTFISGLSGSEFTEKHKVSGKAIRIPILNLIKEEYPDFEISQDIADSELKLYREKYITNLMQSKVGELTDLHKDVIRSLTDDTSIVSTAEEEEIRSYGQIIADKVASFGGSWTFIISFLIFIVLWIGFNIYLLMNKGFDPYPFILLNLILSCIAALQAPVIMMSQNRQEDKDRERAKKDYVINLKSELEIRMLDDKVDHLIMHQQQELIEIQKVQIDMLNDLLVKVTHNNKTRNEKMD